LIIRMASERTWKVVGGGGNGGLVVRESSALSSAQLQTRLSTGSVVREEEMIGNRLRFELISGTGPYVGWVSIRLLDKDLLVRCADNEVNLSTPARPDGRDDILKHLPHRGKEVSERANRKSEPKPERNGTISSKSGDAPPELPKWKELTDAEWRNLLTPYQYSIMRCDGTDMAGLHDYCRFFPETGYFACAGCALPLYSCDSKFEDHGWPAWDKCYFSEEYGCHVGTRNYGMIENHCARCKCHLGHIFFGEFRTQTNERH